MQKSLEKSRLFAAISFLSPFYGWGTGIRTPVMTESESVALPLGDAPIFSTLCIIAEKYWLVKSYFELF